MLELAIRVNTQTRSTAKPTTIEITFRITRRISIETTILEILQTWVQHGNSVLTTACQTKKFTSNYNTIFVKIKIHLFYEVRSNLVQLTFI